jgi:hypothetical protein
VFDGYEVIDLHADEVSKKSTFFYCNKDQTNLNFFNRLLEPNDFIPIPQASYYRKLARNLIHHKKFVSPFSGQTALQHFSNKKKKAITVELSAHCLTPQNCNTLGQKLIRNIDKMRLG